MTVKLTTRPSHGQTVSAWHAEWDRVIADGASFDAGVTRGRSVKFGVTDFGLMAMQHPEWVKMIRSYSNDITYVITAWDTPMAVWVERGEGFWIMPDVKYRSPETGKASPRTTAMQSCIRFALTRSGDQVRETLDS